MRRYENIVQSETAPLVNSLWMHDGKIQCFINGKWVDLINTTQNEKDSPAGTPNYQMYITDIMFVVGGDNSTAREQFEHYGYDYLYDHIPVLLVSGPNQALFGTLAMYYNGQITAVTDGKLVLYNVDYNDETWPVCKVKTVDLTLLPTYVDLEIGNSPEARSLNMEQLMRVAGTQFFVHADYGIGVGTWHPNVGGATTINTAYGDRVHYIITSDGVCLKDENHFDHSELFYDLGQIQLQDLTDSDATGGITIQITDEVQKALFKRASNVVVELATPQGNFEVNCPQTTCGPSRKEFNSPDIAAGQQSVWVYFKIVATITDQKIILNIETF